MALLLAALSAPSVVILTVRRPRPRPVYRWRCALHGHARTRGGLRVDARHVCRCCVAPSAMPLLLKRAFLPPVGLAAVRAGTPFTAPELEDERAAAACDVRRD